MRIAIPRGDIKLVSFYINDMDGTTTSINFTEIYFTVKKTTKDRPYFFQKRLSTGGVVKIESGHYQVKIEPSDTNTMAYGDYKFDVQLVYLDQLKETFVGDFVVTDEVTFDENE